LCYSEDKEWLFIIIHLGFNTALRKKTDMLKLDQESNAYPWITMAIGTGLFSVLSLVTLVLLSWLNLDSPVMVFLVMFLVPLTISLILFDLWLMDGKHRIKMIIISGLTSFVMVLAAALSFPLMMMLYTVGGNGLVTITTPFGLFVLFLVPCLIFYGVLYGKKAIMPALKAYVKASLPVTIVISLMVMGTSNLYSLGLFSGIGAGLGYSLGRKRQLEAIEVSSKAR